MRLFDFECTHCGHRFEELVRTAEEGAELTCPSCGKVGAEKVLSGFAVQGGSKGGLPQAASTGCGSSGFS